MNPQRTNCLDACFICGVKSELTTEDGGVITLVRSWRNANDTVDARCFICDTVVVESAVCYVGWLPEPEEIEALVRSTYPTLTPGSTIWIAPEDRTCRLRLGRRPRAKAAR